MGAEAFQVAAGGGVMNKPDIETVKAIQKRNNLGHVHVVWLGKDGFVLAHTDEERATLGMTLEHCRVHKYLSELSGNPRQLGYCIVVPHEVDAYSESYPVREFDIHQIPAAGLGSFRLVQGNLMTNSIPYNASMEEIQKAAGDAGMDLWV